MVIPRCNCVFSRHNSDLMMQTRRCGLDNAQSTMQTRQCGLDNADSTMWTRQCRLDSVDSTMWIRQCGLDNVDSTVRIRQCRFENADSTMRTLQCGLCNADSAVRTSCVPSPRCGVRISISKCGIGARDAKSRRTPRCRLGNAIFTMRTPQCGLCACQVRPAESTCPFRNAALAIQNSLFRGSAL